MPVGTSYTPPVPDNNLTIQGSITRAQSFASEAFAIAVNSLTEMSSLVSAITTPSLPLTGFSGSGIDTIDLSGLPEAPSGLTASFPGLPAEPVLTDVDMPFVGAAPEFTAVLPSANLDIAAPTALTATVPAEPSLSSVSIPAAPDVLLPDVPSLFGIDIPAVPALDLPAFTATLPDGPAAPNSDFAFTEPGYNSDLLDILNTRLYEMIDGMATGLPPAVEQALWERGRARDAATMLSELEDIRRLQAARGFTQPPGAATVLALQAIQKAKDASATYNREVTIKQAEMEQQNRQFAIQNAIQLEGRLLDYANSVAQRAYDAAKYAIEASVAVFAALVSKYNADIGAYQAQASVFKTLIEGELAKLEIFKAQIEGQKLVSQINVQLVEIYKARIDGARAVIDVFKAEVDAARAQAEVNKTIIESFGVQVQAYDSQVKAKASEYDGYATRIKAEVSKFESYRVQADAYRSQVEGFSASVEATTKVAALQTKINQEIPLDGYKARIEAFRGQVQAVGEQIRAIAETFDAQVKAYAAGVQGQAAGVGAQADVVRAEAQVYQATTQAGIELFKGQLEVQLEKARLSIESIKGAAQIAAQLAAGAMAGISISAGVHSGYSQSDSTSSSTSTSASDSSSNSLNVSHIHTYKED